MATKILRRFLLLGILACVGQAQAHPNGTSKTTIRLFDPDSISITVNCNHDDVLNAIHFVDRPKYMQPPTRDDAQAFQTLLKDYLQARVRLQVDGRDLEGLKVSRWKAGGKGPQDDFTGDTAAFWNSNFEITLSGALPNPRKSLNISVQLFAEFDVQPISEVSLVWQDTLLERHWLGLDRSISFPLDKDSLNALLNKSKAAPNMMGVSKSENLVLRFIMLGFTHILPQGLDHILFVLGLFFFSTRMRPLFFQITAFTVAHSITLGLSLVGIFSLPSRIVEPLIALSIAVVGMENIFFRKAGSSRWIIVFCFGLVHGLGFAGALRELGLPPGRFWSTLASFNLGVELGQITVISSAFLLTRWLWNKPWYFRRVSVPISSVITVVAMYWVAQRTIGF